MPRMNGSSAFSMVTRRGFDVLLDSSGEVVMQYPTITENGFTRGFIRIEGGTVSKTPHKLPLEIGCLYDGDSSTLRMCEVLTI